MNYLAHALDRLDDPYEVAGAAVPDWLCLTQPRVRCRSRHAASHVESTTAEVAAVARGVMHHHADDDWFHTTAAFGDVSLALARSVRAATGDADGMRPGFIGHVLLEMLLDAALAESQPSLLDSYYAALERVEPSIVASAVSEISGADAAQLARIVPRFVQMRFLYDYTDDERLLFRLNQVLQRVRLPALDAGVRTMLPEARAMVGEARGRLLARPASAARRPWTKAAPARIIAAP